MFIDPTFKKKSNSLIRLPIKDFQCEIINGDFACQATWGNVTSLEQCYPRPAALGNIAPSG